MLLLSVLHLEITDATRPKGGTPGQRGGAAVRDGNFWDGRGARAPLVRLPENYSRGAAALPSFAPHRGTTLYINTPPASPSAFRNPRTPRDSNRTKEAAAGRGREHKSGFACEARPRSDSFRVKRGRHRRSEGDGRLLLVLVGGVRRRLGPRLAQELPPDHPRRPDPPQARTSPGLRPPSLSFSSFFPPWILSSRVFLFVRRAACWVCTTG
jgi:hypothetical protein